MNGDIFRVLIHLLIMMRKFENQVQQIKYEVLREISRLAMDITLCKVISIDPMSIWTNKIGLSIKEKDYLDKIEVIGEKIDDVKVKFKPANNRELTFLIPKLVLVVIMFGEDVVRVVQKLLSHVSSTPTQPIPSRRLFISKLALGLAAIPFASFLYGIFKGAIIIRS